jgi:hypothetical protein
MRRIMIPVFREVSDTAGCIAAACTIIRLLPPAPPAGGHLIRARRPDPARLLEDCRQQADDALAFLREPAPPVSRRIFSRRQAPVAAALDAGLEDDIREQAALARSAAADVELLLPAYLGNPAAAGENPADAARSVLPFLADAVRGLSGCASAASAACRSASGPGACPEAGLAFAAAARAAAGSAAEIRYTWSQAGAPDPRRMPYRAHAAAAEPDAQVSAYDMPGPDAADVPVFSRAPVSRRRHAEPGRDSGHGNSLPR